MGVSMAFVLKEWKEKFPGVPESELYAWLSDIAVKGVPKDEEEDFVEKRFQEWKSGGGELEHDDAGGKLESSDTSDDSYDEEMYGSDEKDEKSVGEVFKENVENTKVEDEGEVYDDIPFENPDLSSFDVPEEDDDDGDDDEGLVEEPVSITPPKRRPRFSYEDEMVTKKISLRDFNEITKPFKSVLDKLKYDGDALMELANSIDENNAPPYMLLRNYVINHKIKEADSVTVPLTMVNESDPSGLVLRSIPLSEAKEVARGVAEVGHIQKSFDNFITIIDRYDKLRVQMTSLIYILEFYCENKDVPPFELSVPKKVLVDSIDKSFKEIEGLITKNVIAQLKELRSDLGGELGSVSELVEKNMTRFDSNIQEAVTKVLWKVKTDVESTNLEDIKKSLLWLLNRRTLSYKYGGVATAVMSVLLNDFEELLIGHDFKFDSIKTRRKYTLTELSKRLNYAHHSVLRRAVPDLIRAKLIILYDNKVISLAI